MRDVWPRVRDVPPRLNQDALMVVAVQEGILDVSLTSVLGPAGCSDPVRLQTRLLQHDVQLALCRGRTALGDMRLDREHEGVRLLHKRVVARWLHFSCLGRREWACGPLVHF